MKTLYGQLTAAALALSMGAASALAQPEAVWNWAPSVKAAAAR